VNGCDKGPRLAVNPCLEVEEEVVSAVSGRTSHVVLVNFRVLVHQWCCREAFAELASAALVICASPVGFRVRNSALMSSGALEDLPWPASSEILGL
jgi:hypothetical protein